MKLKLLLFSICSVLVLSACGPSEAERVQKELSDNYLAAEAALTNLDSQLESGTLRNAILLAPYAKKARQNKPEFGKIIDVLESEGTRQGPTYRGISERLKAAGEQVTSKVKTAVEAQPINLELLSIQAAINNYDAMLVDALNMLSEFTDGDLPKLREIEFEDGSGKNGAVGSEYVGNSNYGQWRTDSSGNSFWHWYGQYAFFSSLIGGPVYYDSWSNRRRPSYYHDRARGAYTSPKAKSNHQQVLDRTKKSYTAKGKSFNSPYAKHTRIKGQPASSSRNAPKQPFKSNYAKRSSSSSSSKKYKSGYNSRSSSRSRSSFGGK